MLKIYSKLLLTSTLLSATLYADNIKSKTEIKKSAFETVWEHTYGGEDDDIANGIVMLENGDTAIVGTCKSYNAKRSDICVMRMDSKGKMKWRKMLGGKKKDRGLVISRASDGNLLVAGEGKSFNHNADQDLYIAKLSLTGKVLWEHAFGGDRDEYIAGVAGTNDGGALLIGNSESFSKKGYKDIYIVRLDKEGKMLSTQTIGGKLNDEATALTRTADGNFIMVGSREVKHAGNADFFLMKLNQSGQKIWARTLGQKDNDVLTAVAPTPNGGIVATGRTRSYNSAQTDLAVMNFNKEGKLVWFKIYGFKYYDEGNAITMSKNGEYLLAGKTNSMGKGDYDIYTIALDKEGTLIWSSLYGKENKDIAHAVTRTSDGGLIIVGESDSFSRSKNFYIIKLK